MIMSNKIVLFYKPFLSFSRIFYRNVLNSQVVQNIPQKAFSEKILLDVRAIENIWRRSKNNHIFNKHVYRCCSETSDLLTYIIDIIHCVSNRNSVSPILAFEMVKTFSNYIQDNSIQFKTTMNQNIDLLSSVLNFKNYQLIQLVCNVFKFHENPLDYKEFILKLIQEKKFSEAAYVVSALHLQKEFDDKEILLPLILEGNVHFAAVYMTNHPDIQLKVVKFLDGYLNTENFVSDSNARPRKVFKTLSSLVNVFKIPLDNCPNLQFIRSKGAINILVQRRSQQSVSEATWEDMIKNIVRDNEDLKKHLIRKLLLKKDMKTALKMVEDLNVNDSSHFLSETINQFSIHLKDDQSEDLELPCDIQDTFDIHDISDEYLKFSLKADDIKVINNKEDFVNCINDINQNYKMIGIDSEWKPHFGLSSERLSLIQLAVHDKVYILDILLLSEYLETEHWDKLLDDIFGNPNIIKLGCGIMSDVHMILESIKGTKGKAVKFSHILDMVLFYEKLQEVYPVEMSNRSDKNFTKGLSSLCDIILGKPLNKEDRLCDWEKRPLQEKQLEYAALDAHCLLQMYDKLKEESIEKNMNFDHLSKVAIVLTASQWKPKRKYKGKKFGEEFHVHNLVPIEQLKVVVDSSFEDQAKELRKLGADVVIVNSANKAIMISRNEGRIVICSEELYCQIKHKIKDGFCYYFSSKSEVKVANFLQHFNAQVSTNSMSTRCVNCNSNNGLKLSTEDLETLHDLCKINTSINSVLRDNLTSFSSELQMVLSEILSCGIIVEFSSKEYPSLVNEHSFLCKTCGHIS